MKFVFLCKRRPQGKDLFERPYGRFYYLPKALTEKGHEVHILLLSYKNEPRISVKKEGINWYSISALKQGLLSYLRESQKLIKMINPDWVGGFSDTYYGILAQQLASKYKTRSLIDAYDNYESYIPWLKPLHTLWQKSISRADLVTAAGPGLAGLLGKSRPGKLTEIISMAADPIFQPMDKIECRRELGLPINKKLIGYSGSTIHKSRGPDTLFQAFNILKTKLSDIELVLTGKKGRNVSIPAEALWLRYIPDEHMPLLMNSLDVLVVLNRPSSFGNYSYPVKLYEAMACQTPVVVSKTLSTEWIIKNNRDFLVDADDVKALCNSLSFALNLNKFDYGVQKNWQQAGSEFEELLSNVNKF